MNPIDAVALALVSASVLLGLWRGLVREAVSLAAWVLAFLAGRHFGPALAVLLPPGWQPQSLRLAVGFLLVGFAALLVLGLAGVLLSGLVRAAGLSLPDRVLGGLFGLARGVVLLVAATVLAGLTPLSATAEWRGARSTPWLEHAARTLLPWLPPSLARQVRYDS